MNEPDLILRARQGDQRAWEALVLLHQEPVFRFAYLILGDSDEAEDAAQEAMIRAYQALDRFDLERPLRPWLLSIAANLSRNRRRSLNRYFSALQRLVRSEPTFAATVEDYSLKSLEAQALWQAVRRLGRTDQEVIYLRFFLEMSLEEVAETMGTALGTVKSRLHRALSRLQGVIQREFPGLSEGLNR